MEQVQYLSISDIAQRYSQLQERCYISDCESQVSVICPNE